MRSGNAFRLACVAEDDQLLFETNPLLTEDYSDINDWILHVVRLEDYIAAHEKL